MKTSYSISVKVWLYDGAAAWHFITVPIKTSSTIKKTFSGFERGWGSLPVLCTIKSTSWKTSVFWDTKKHAYILPLKADIRKKEKIAVGNNVKLEIKLLLD